MAETNITSVWNAAGCLEFRQGNMPSNVTGPVLCRFNATGNGMDIQLARTAAAGANAANVAIVCNFSFMVTDNTGTTYYIPASASAW